VDKLLRKRRTIRQVELARTRANVGNLKGRDGVSRDGRMLGGACAASAARFEGLMVILFSFYALS